MPKIKTHKGTAKVLKVRKSGKVKFIAQVLVITQVVKTLNSIEKIEKEIV